MKNVLYLYLLLISTSACAMQTEKKQPVNKKPFITNQELGGAILIAVPLVHTALTPLCIVAPPLTAAMVFVGAMKIGSTALGTAMIIDANDQRKQNNKQFRS